LSTEKSAVVRPIDSRAAAVCVCDARQRRKNSWPAYSETTGSAGELGDMAVILAHLLRWFNNIYYKRFDDSTTSEGAAMSPSATKKAAKKTTARNTGTTSKGFTPEERAAMKERAKELKMAANREEGEKALLAAIAKMPKPDRAMGKRLHELVGANAPDLAPKTWYGMPAYARDDKVVCFFQSADKFKARYATLGFTDTANLDKGAMWPTSFALKELTPAVEKEIARLVKRAVS
jgi:uncharacterized protein YdhG (YjbR/CyaY superfamily)